MNTAWTAHQPNTLIGIDDQVTTINGTTVVVRYDAIGRNWYAYRSGTAKMISQGHATREAAKAAAESEV